MRKLDMVGGKVLISSGSPSIGGRQELNHMLYLIHENNDIKCV